jgi:hypothetical protein
MHNAPRPHDVPRRRRLTDASTLDRDALVRLTNERGDHHLDHVTSGEDVTLCGRVISVAFPPNMTWATVCVDDGTGMVEFAVPRDGALDYVGATVEVAGTLTAQKGKPFLTDAVITRVQAAL